MDQDVFASLARIRILLLPVGSISRTEFEKWAEEISHLSEIRLSDVPTDSREDRGAHLQRRPNCDCIEISPSSVYAQPSCEWVIVTSLR